MPQTPATLSYQTPGPPRRRPRYLLPLFFVTLLATVFLLPDVVLMGLVFRALPFLTVDNAQAPVVVAPLVLVLLNGAAVAQLLLLRARGLAFATAGLALSLLSLALAVFFWVPAFKA
jgi:hypothetical protein